LDAIAQNFILFNVPFNEKSNIYFRQYTKFVENTVLEGGLSSGP